MTKKHFVMLAEVIRLEITAQVSQQLTNAFHADCSSLTSEIVAAVACEMADFCQSQNAQFDRERFLQACGIS